MAATVGAVRRQYERWPYPHVPILGSVRALDTWQIAHDFLRDRCGLGAAPAHPRIWIAGCGTMQPYVFRIANPRAHILATDLSQRSLHAAERRCNWHGAYGVDFEHVDLTDSSALPPGPFDQIECYGVLMNLQDPLAALRALAARLAPGGVLRIMVYPQYSRQRIFQVQQVARLCGLHLDDATAPRALRRIMAALPTSHPLRHAFDGYSDARSDAGLVDGFLHAGDRGFTGLELGALCQAAGLRPAFWFQRPWAQPGPMASALGLEHSSAFFVMHYLDLWQELRGNFVLCLTRDDQPTTTDDSPLQLHPHLRSHRSQATTPTDWARRKLRRWTGTTLPSRLGDPVTLSGAAVRRLNAGSSPTGFVCDEQSTREDEIRMWREQGVLLGGPARANTKPTLADFGGRCEPDLGLDALVAAGAHPLYAHLFQAWHHNSASSDGWLASQPEQRGRWEEHADPLESSRCPLGLTPFGSWQAMNAEQRQRIDSVVDQARILTDQSHRVWQQDGPAIAASARDQLAQILRDAHPEALDRVLDQAADCRALAALLLQPSELFTHS